jgi:phosphoglycolate phosphatase
MLGAVIFDLDGVLIDSLASVRASMNHALGRLGRPLLVGDEARAYIGPPLAQTAPRLMGDDDPAQSERFIAMFRAHYDETAEATTAAMPHLSPVIHALADRWPLALATSKPEVYARRLLDVFGITGAFRTICGSSLEHHDDTKATIIGRALGALGLAAEDRAVMVGDRSYDVRGAAAHGIRTIGAAYGMGGAQELREAGATWLIDGLDELPALLDRLDTTL